MSRGKQADPFRAEATILAKERGWDVAKSTNNRAVLKCPFPCECMVVVNASPEKRGKLVALSQVRRCPGYIEAMPPASVEEFRLPPPAIEADPPPAPPKSDPVPTAPRPEPNTEPTPSPTVGRETPMSKRPDRPEYYELIAEFFCETPNVLVSIQRLAEALGVTGEDAEYAGQVMGSLHDNTMRRVLGVPAERSAANTAYHRFRAKGGLFYRAATGAYVLDTAATITSGHRISGNRWPVILGNVPRTAKAGNNHPYRNLVELAPQGTPPTPAPLPQPATSTYPPDPAPAATPNPIGDLTRQTPAAERQRPPSDLPPVVPAVAPMGQVVTLLARDFESGSIMLRIGDEIVTAQISSSMQVVA